MKKVLFVLLLIMACSVFPAAHAYAAFTERVSVDNYGLQANDESFMPAISADGRYVAFASRDIIGSVSERSWKTFVHDRLEGTTQYIAGGQPAGISADGNYVIAGTTVYERQTRTAVATVPYGGWYLDISADGRYVSFEAWVNSMRDIFVLDTVTGSVEKASVNSNGQTSAQVYNPYSMNGSTNSSISDDGRFVSFTSFAYNLVPDDTNGLWDIFVRDRQTGLTERVSVDSAGVQANANSARSRLSGDGRYVVFHSSADNLVAGDTNGVTDVFVHDRQTHETRRVSIDSAGNEGNGTSLFADIDQTGRHVVFASYADNLVAGDTNGAADVFVHDLLTGVTERISVSSDGSEGNGDSYSSYYTSSPPAAINGDGSVIAFESLATNLVPGDTNGYMDVFVHDKTGGDYNPASVFILDDATGGSCIYFGTWDPATRTCTLAEDIHNATIGILSSGVTVDGNGHILSSSDNSGYGVYVYGVTGVTVRNLIIDNFRYGIYFERTGVPMSDVAIQNIQFVDDTYGIYMNSSGNLSWNILIDGNTFANVWTGIYMWSCRLATISNNVFIGRNDIYANQNSGDLNYAISSYYGSGDILNNTITGFGIGMYLGYPNISGSGRSYAFAVEQNLIEFNRIGMITYYNWGPSYARNNTISSNVIGELSWTGDMFDFMWNNFINNQTQVVPNSSSHNYYYGNYWSTYDSPEEGCYNANGDMYCDAPYVFGPYPYQDNAPVTYIRTGAPPPTNLPPVANAGVDRAEECTSSSGTNVVLDGTGSSDPDNDTLTYAWTGPFGTASGPQPEVVLPYGESQITLTVNDGKGGTDTDTVVITIEDTTSPVTVVDSIIGTQGDNGWFVTDVTVNLSASDSCTGVHQLHYTVDGAETIVQGSSASVYVQADGTHTVTYWTVDNAENSEATNNIVIDIDMTAPVITYALTPAPNAAGWNTGDVTVTFTCTDETSGVASCPAPVTVSTEGAGQVVSGTAIDTAGNEASTQVTLNIDLTDPAITASVSPGANGYGWQNSAVTVSFACSDALSGIEQCSGPVVVDTEGAARQVTGTAVDMSGRQTSVSVAVSLDTTGPAITITGIADGAEYALGLVPVASYTVTDNLSGVMTSTDALSGGDVYGLGTFTYSVSAEDYAGNPSSATATYTVIATTSGTSALIDQTVTDPAISAALNDNLADAQANIDAGSYDQAIQDLDSFKKTVDKEKDKGNISPEDAAVLTAVADYMMQAIQGM